MCIYQLLLSLVCRATMGTLASHLLSEEKPVKIDESSRNDHIVFDKGLNFMVLCNQCRVLENTGIHHEIWIVIIDFIMRVKVDDIIKDALFHGWHIKDNGAEGPRYFLYSSCTMIGMGVFHYTMPHYIFIKKVRHNQEYDDLVNTTYEAREKCKPYGLNKYQHWKQFESLYETKSKAHK